MFVTRRKINGELEIGQDSTKLKQAQKIKELRPQEKAAMMGLGMMVSLKIFNKCMKIKIYKQNQP